ncbi:hypothetical protein ACH4PW_05290 [Streptomyces sp. NPDC017082]
MTFVSPNADRRGSRDAPAGGTPLVPAARPVFQQVDGWLVWRGGLL